MKKKLIFALSVMLAIMMLTPLSIDAAKKKTTKKTKAKVQQTDQNLNKLNNPSSACNQGDESLRSFMNKFIADKKFRKERSKLAIMGYYDEKTGKFDYYGTGSGKGRQRLDYDVTFSWIDEQNSWQSMFTPGKKVSRYNNCKNTTEGKWQMVEANLAIYKWQLSAECAGGEGGGTMLQFTFQRKDGKWLLAVVSSVG